MHHNLHNSLMLVTALNPYIGYENAAKTAKKAFAENTHTAYLLWDGETLAGTGAVSYFQVMPTVHNPTGRKAYLMNLYTAPQYRRQGIATRILTRLVEDAHRRGVTAISLEATAMGRPLYEKFGFVPMEHEMELPE